MARRQLLVLTGALALAAIATLALLRYRDEASSERLEAMKSLLGINRGGGVVFLNRALGRPDRTTYATLEAVRAEIWGFEPRELKTLVARWGGARGITIMQWRSSAVFGPPTEVNALVDMRTDLVWLLAVFRSEFDPPTNQAAE